jgi:hypothetical protein
MSDEAQTLLASAEYEEAFNAVMSGTELAALPQAQRDLLVRARDLTNTPAPGWPMPAKYDATRSDQG